MRSKRENIWGTHPPNGGWAAERFPAFRIEMTDYQSGEGPGNISSTDYLLRAFDGDLSVEIACSNRGGTTRFEFRGRKYVAQVHEDEDGIGYSVWPDASQSDAPLPWLPFELDGVRIDEDTDLVALVSRTLAGWTPPAARPIERDTPGRWALKLWSSLAATGLEDEIEQAAEANLQNPDSRAAALAFFEELLRSPDPWDQTQPSCLARVKRALRSKSKRR